MMGRLVRTKPLWTLPAPIVATVLLLRGVWIAGVFAVRHWRFSAPCALAAWMWMSGYAGVTVATVAIAIGAAAVAAGVCRWLRPAVFTRWVELPVRGWWRKRTLYGKRWEAAMRLSGLSATMDHRVHVPRLHRVVCTPAADRLVIRLLMGQDPDDFRDRAPQIAYAFGARQARVLTHRPDPRPVRSGRLAWLWHAFDGYCWADRPAEVHIVIVRRDCLAVVVAPFQQPQATAVDLSALPVAVSELGDVFSLRLLSTHLLIAGASRRGKGSVVWSIIHALAPTVHNGLTQLWVIDPKGGMELAMGRAMFTRFAYQAATDIADILDEAVTVMRDRQARLAGKVRALTPNVSEPFIVIVVDELGALTKYITDTELRKRIDAALGLLLSQGAGLGICVVGALQDPRKDTLDLRDLFLSRIILGVTAASHIDMVLGDGMRARGALADQLTPDQAGVGYVLADGAADPLKVRFTYLTDADIVALAATYPAPTPAVQVKIPTQAAPTSNGHAPLIPAQLLHLLGETGQGGDRP